jgi:hypothetical protein
MVRAIANRNNAWEMFAQTLRIADAVKARSF